MPSERACAICSRPLPEDGVCVHCSTQRIAKAADASLPEIAGYRTIRSLGEGGMGAIYLAEDISLGRQVAVKTISSKLSQEPEALSRFRREARAMATVSHPHVVHVHALSEKDGQAYIVMEYVEGENLAQRIRRMGRLPVDEALRIAHQVAEALDAAWEKQIVHRDVKPSNILIDRKGRVRVADFGLAKPLTVEGDSSLTQAGHLLGTPHYLSPEQARGVALDFHSDVYSLGIVLYEMLAGEPPYEGATPYSLVDKHLHEPLPSVLEKRPDVPPQVVRVLAWMTAKDPEDRPASYAELLAALALPVPAGGSTAPIPATDGPQAASTRDVTEARRQPVDATRPPVNAAAAITDRQPRARRAETPAPARRSQSDFLKWAAGALSLLLVVTMSLRGIRLRSVPPAAAQPLPRPAATSADEQRAGSPPKEAPATPVMPAPPAPIAGEPDAGISAAAVMTPMPVLAVMYINDAAADERLRKASIGMILSDAFVQIMNDVGGIRVVSPARMDSELRMLGKTFKDTSDLEAARTICAKTEATMFLVGSLSHVGQTYVLSATLNEFPSQKLLGSYRATARSEDAILDELTGKVAADLKESVAKNTGATLAGGRAVSALATTDVDAYGHYVHGADLILEGRPEEAVAELEKAVAIDPKMAIAWSELGCAYSFAGNEPKARDSQRKALEMSSRLSEKEKLWVNCNSLWIEDKPGADFVECQQRFLELYPDDRNAYLYIGFGQRWLNHDCAAALPFYDKAYALTPTYFAITKEIAECNVELGKKDAALAAVKRFLGVCHAGHAREQGLELQASLER
ncbi:MAG: protein kinase [Acidobacteriota bacterium]